LQLVSAALRPRLSGEVTLHLRDILLALLEVQLAPINQASHLALMLLQVFMDLAPQVPHQEEEDPLSLTLHLALHSVALPTALMAHLAHSDLLSQEAQVDLVLLDLPKDLLHHLDLVSQEALLDLLLLEDLVALKVLALLVSHLDLPDPVLPALLKAQASQVVLVPLLVFVALELLSPHKALVVLRALNSLVHPAAHRLLQVYLHPVVQVAQDSQALLPLPAHQDLLLLLLTLKPQHSQVPLKDLLLLVHQMDPLAPPDLKIPQDQANHCLLVHQVLLLALQDHLNLMDLPSPLVLKAQLSLRVPADQVLPQDLLDLVLLPLHKLLVALRALNSLQDLANLVHLKDLALLQDLLVLNSPVAQLDLQLLRDLLSLRVLVDLHILRVLKVPVSLRVLANLVPLKDLVLPLDLKVLKALDSPVLLVDQLDLANPVLLLSLVHLKDLLALKVLKAPPSLLALKALVLLDSLKALRDLPLLVDLVPLASLKDQLDPELLEDLQDLKVLKAQASPQAQALLQDLDSLVPQVDHPDLTAQVLLRDLVDLLSLSLLRDHQALAVP
jgi:hypothetical protein